MDIKRLQKFAKDRRYYTQKNNDLIASLSAHKERTDNLNAKATQLRNELAKAQFEEDVFDSKLQAMTKYVVDLNEDIAGKLNKLDGLRKTLHYEADAFATSTSAHAKTIEIGLENGCEGEDEEAQFKLSQLQGQLDALKVINAELDRKCIEE